MSGSKKIYASSKERKRAYKERQKNLPSEFIAIDGEGITVEGIHLYTLLAASDNSQITNPNGLDTLDCLDYLINLKLQYPKHIFVSFYFSYDVNMMLKDFPVESIQELSSTNECSIRSTESRCSYKLLYIPGKFIKISKYLREDTQKKYIGTIKIWDVFGFFQGSFLKALQLYKIGTSEELTIIQNMKQKRDKFTSEDDFQVKDYNNLECDLLVRLMQKLDTCLLSIDLKLSSWLGAGAIAAKLMSIHNIKEHLTEAKENHYIPVRCAYFGGRIQALQLGQFDKVYAHDIVSAYPSIIANLPSLKDSIQYTTKVVDNNPIVVYHIKWNLPENCVFTPFPFRVVDGGIHYPLNGEGYYWSCEVVNALKYYPDYIDIIKGYGFYTNEEKPFSFVNQLFDARKVFKAEGNHTQLVIKLGLNSLYGKTAQTISYKDTLPPYQSFIYAGLITANTRAKLFDVCMQSPDNIIAFCTDGIYSTKLLDNIDIGNNLGQWEVDYYDSFFIVKPGFYQGLKGDKETSTTRGFRRSTVDFETLKTEWNNNGLAGSVTVQDSHFIGMKQSKGNSETWRHWVNPTRTLNFWPSRDYPKQISERPCQFRMLPPQKLDGISLPYRYTEIEKNLLETEIID